MSDPQKKEPSVLFAHVLWRILLPCHNSSFSSPLNLTGAAALIFHSSLFKYLVHSPLHFPHSPISSFMEIRRRTPNLDHHDVDLSFQPKSVSAQKGFFFDETSSKEWKRNFRLLEYHALPDYLKDNEYILAHYRADFTFGQALNSLFKLHNETVNIWTHLLGFLFFLWLTVLMVMDLWQLPSSLSQCFWFPSEQGNISEHCLLKIMKQEVFKMVNPILNRTTRWPFFVFMGGSMFCLLASTVCHLFTCHSEPVAIFLMRIDYTGIAIMIATSFFPPIYYVFQCTPIWQWVYLGSISTMAVVTVGVLFAPACQRGEYRVFRALLFLTMGISGLIPAVHGVVTNWHEPFCAITVVHEAIMAGFYGLGTLIYVSRVPERWKPGLFDLGGHSHNLFHILVMAGAYTHYRAALLFLEWRESAGCIA